MNENTLKTIIFNLEKSKLYYKSQANYWNEQSKSEKEESRKKDDIIFRDEKLVKVETIDEIIEMILKETTIIG